MKLPPLNPLRVFESASHTLSFTQTARELHVTTGAVSRQIRVLEEFLGARLFERGSGEVRLTPAGREYRDDLRGAFERIGMATAKALSRSRTAPLQVWCQMTFAMRWLLPRMAAFQSRHPERDVVLTTSLKQLESLSDAEVAICIGHGDWPGVVSRRLVDIELVPVCSPRLLPAGQSRLAPADLARFTLLQSAARPDYWGHWLAANGVGHIDPARGLTFENATLAYQAALQGMGVAMGQYALVEDDLKAGRLVAPFGDRLGIDSAFYLVYPERLEKDAHLCDFRDWVLEAAGRDPRALSRG